MSVLPIHDSGDELLTSLDEVGKCLTLWEQDGEWIAEIGAREFYGRGPTPGHAIDLALDGALGTLPAGTKHEPEGGAR